MILSIKIDLKSEKEKIYQMHHDIRMNALIALLVKIPKTFPSILTMKKFAF